MRMTSMLMVAWMAFTLGNAGWSAQLKNINFYQKDEISYVDLDLDASNIKANKFHVTEDKQIIIDLEGVAADSKVMRPFDTSEFSGSVVFVSAYKKPGKEGDLRVAIQLRDNVRSLLRSDGTKISVGIENRFGVFSQKEFNEGATEEKKVAEGQESNVLNVPKTENVEDILENITLSGPKKYVGKKISFRVTGVPISEILNMIALSSGFNIIWDDEVAKLPPYTLNMVNIPWDQALDTVLDLGKLVATKNGNILMVTTLSKATAEKKVEVEAEALNQKLEPLVTRIFPVSFADPKEISEILKDYQTAERGTMKIDTRTNQLIVKDTVEVIEKMKKILETLDTQTPQILIEAKVVEASESFSQEIGLSNGIEFGYDALSRPSSDDSSSDDTDTTATPTFSFASAPINGQGARTFLGFHVDVFKRISNLDFALQLMEKESKGKIVSSPKVIAQNNKEAQLTKNDTTAYLSTTVEDGVTTQGWSQATATVDLKVKPKVTNDGSIIMDVNLTKSGFKGTSQGATAPPDMAENKITTNVLVDNGSTIVLGGLYQYSDTESHSGVPFLKDIPIVGWLFRTAFNPATEKSELIIFITPRVINQEEAGLTERESEV